MPENVVSTEASSTPYSNIRITPISDPSHPANGQSGLFANKALKPGTFILLYLGNVHPETDVEAKESDYDLWLDRDAGIAVDASRSGNEARFVNDYRGVKDRPNAEFREVWSARHQERCMAVFVLPERKNSRATKKPAAGKASSAGAAGKASASSGAGAAGILKGEEILVSYGKGFWGARIPDSGAVEKEPDIPMLP
ncbi:unnamed protein product [Parascedosporium putredinis]|uniref:SET domain-containing protein n=1 Tax=Parascedosporium putredinis TaxID=1442378 RepID=A0A9P1H2J6_9PEZI|nr:unnamed protein product [Parascedosporium putredinis]CAI7996060.1 unnamed protein product [Parascedosporium putredinis]